MILRASFGCSDVTKVQDGIGDKLGNFFQWISTCIAGMVIGFVYGWKLSLAIMATSPLLVASGIVFTKVLAAVCFYFSGKFSV